MARETVIATRELAKHYRDVRAVDGLTLQVCRGEVYGFLGRNGAGKTTTIRMLLGLIRPTSGEVTLFGLRGLRSGAAAFARIGYFVEIATAYPNLTVRLPSAARIRDLHPRARQRLRCHGLGKVVPLLDRAALYRNRGPAREPARAGQLRSRAAVVHRRRRSHCMAGAIRR